jgi:hypothetical protein
MKNTALVEKPQLTAAERNANNTARVLRDNRGSRFCTPLSTSADHIKTAKLVGRTNEKRTQ